MISFKPQASHTSLRYSLRCAGRFFAVAAICTGGSLSPIFSEEAVEKPSVLIKTSWEANKNKEHKEAIEIADRCIELYKETAKRQQSQLTEYPTSENAHKYYILNTVGQCYNVKSKSHLALGQTEKAKEALKTLINEYHFSQAGGKDNRKPLLDDAKARLKAIKSMH